MKRISLVILVMLLEFDNSVVSAQSTTPVVVPFATCQTIMTDGRIEKSEWQGSVRIPIGDSSSILLKQTDDYIFMAIRIPFRLLAYVDVYFDYGAGYIHNLHTSSQLGERKLLDTAWDAPANAFHFGNSDGWYANEQRFDRIRAQDLLRENPARDRNLMQLETFFPYDGFEYILKKSRFSWQKFKFRVEVKTSMPGQRSLTFPVDSEAKDSGKWQSIVLN